MRFFAVSLKFQNSQQHYVSMWIIIICLSFLVITLDSRPHVTAGVTRKSAKHRSKFAAPSPVMVTAGG
jgi:hypothetical protein